MTNETSDDELDYDKLIEYELNHLDDVNYLEDVEENNVLENNITETDSFDVVLEKIFKTHEDFYKKCFDNAVDDSLDDDDDNIVNKYRNTEKVDEKTKQILSYYNLTYEQFVETISNIKNDFENDPDVKESNTVENDLKTNADISETPLKDLIDHDKIMQEINVKKWNEYDRFYREFDERCQSARSISQKELQQEASLAKCKRQEQKANLDQQLILLQENLNVEEAENKARLMEIDLEIQQEKEILINLQRENKEIIDSKLNWAAITIQKYFRRYRVRKRIGSQIDEARNSARRKLFNAKLIINEKKVQKQKAAELRKWRHEKEKEKRKMNDDRISKIHEDLVIPVKVSEIDFHDSSKKNKLNESDNKINNKLKVKINKKLNQSNIIDENVDKSISIEGDDNNYISYKLAAKDNVEEIKIINDTDGTQSVNKIEFQKDNFENNDSNYENKNLGNILYFQHNNSNSHFFESKFSCIPPEVDNVSKVNPPKMVEKDIDTDNSAVSTLSDNVNDNYFHRGSVNETFSSESNESVNEVNMNIAIVGEHVNTPPISGRINILYHHGTSSIKIETKPRGGVDNVESSPSYNSINSFQSTIPQNDTSKETFDLSVENLDLQLNEESILENVTLTSKEIYPNTDIEFKRQTINDIVLVKQDLFLELSENSKQINCINEIKSLPKTNENTEIIIINNGRQWIGSSDVIERTNENTEIQINNENRTSNESRYIIEGTNENTEIQINNENTKSNESRDIIEGTNENIEIQINNENIKSNGSRYINEGTNENTEIHINNENRTSVENHDITEATNENTEIHINNENTKSNESRDIIEKHSGSLSEIPKPNSLVTRIQSLNQNEKSPRFIINEDKIKNIFQSNVKSVLICLEWMHQIIDDKNNSTDSLLVSDVESELSIPMIPRHFLKNSNSHLSLDNNCSPNSVTMTPNENSPNTCKSLFISKSQMDSVTKLKTSFSILEHLVLNETSTNYFHMDDLPESIKSININQNQIEWAYFGQNIESNLSILSCSSNELADLPFNAFRNCSNIIHINFSNNNFVNIDSIFHGNIPLKKLCSLNLNNNVLSSLDNLDTYCPNLTHLSVSGNHIKSWSLRNKFPNLVELDISHNSLTSLQAWSNTPLMVNLNLSYNLLTDIQSFQYSWMPCLSVLILDCNKLTSIPELCFLSLQKISIQRNFLSESINCENLFQHCPLLSLINLKDNPTSQNISKRYMKNQGTDKEIICPDGEFANGCYDFSDSIHQKSARFDKLLKSTSDLDLAYKHQIHYYRFIREMVEDYSVWSEEILFNEKSNNKKYEKIHCESAIKIQSLWRGYKTKKWYKSILSYVRFDMEENFDELGLVDVSEYEKPDLINNWNDFQEIPTVTEAWINPSENLKGESAKMNFTSPVDTYTNEIVISGNGSTHRSNSTSTLNRKELEIMKEWGFEDPNSALWMLERAKKFHKKPIKNSKRQILSQIQKPTLQTVKISNINLPKAEMNLQKNSFHMVPLNTVTIHPPESVHNSNFKSKIDQWLNDSDFMPNVPSSVNPDKRSFLPAIELENQFKIISKVPLNCSHPKSSTTKLPAINYVPGNV